MSAGNTSSVAGEVAGPAAPAWIEVITLVLSLGLFGFVLYTALFGEYSSDIQRGVPFAVIAVLILLRFPVVNGARWMRLIDLALMMAAVYAVLYVSINGELIARRIGRLNPADVTASLLGIVALFEISRRTVGWILPGLALLFCAYAGFGNYLPDAFAVAGASPQRVALAGWVGSDGVFGIAFGVMVGVVYVYMLLAALMERSGGTNALVHLAHFATRGTRSGPGMTTVVSSALFGMASGSGVADVVAVGTANIPAMKRAGYSPPFAAGVQALSSIGAQVMPPVMGSSAFILAELTGTPYARVAMMAIIPALLYYLCVAAAVYFEARRLNLTQGGPPPLPMTLMETAIGVVPLGVLIWLLVDGMGPAKAGFIAVATVLVIGVARRNLQLSPRRLVAALVEGTVSSLPLWSATALIGLIVAAVTLTGMTNDVSLLVIKLSQDSLLLALVVIMIASIILGTALPTIAAYLLLVVMVAPALTGLGVPLIVAHFFIFYYGVTSDLTPPTALAPLTASVIAGADFWETCWHTMRVGLPIFVLPFTFVYQPALLLLGTTEQIVAAALSCAFAVLAFAAGASGFLVARLGVVGRVLLLSSGLALIVPDATVAVAGFVVLVAVGAVQHYLPAVARLLRV